MDFSGGVIKNVVYFFYPPSANFCYQSFLERQSLETEQEMELSICRRRHFELHPFFGRFVLSK
jgi:hypothetical protein